MLFAPHGLITSSSPPPLGGHILWLGPQSLWHWPPPLDWQSLDAIAPCSRGTTLHLRHTHSDHRLPRLLRSYAWHGEELVCSSEWEGSESLHAVHILQIPQQFIVYASVCKELESGFAMFEGYNLERFPSPPLGVVTDGESLRIRYTGESSKFALAPQTLRAVRGTCALEMSPCLFHPTRQNSPDQGLITQVWRGNAELPFLEIEQLSEWHRRSDGTQSTIRLKMIRAII